ncbi:uncharacterized protein LOC127811033 [Diospyros lotus]|uniref:uncharacterized protein LOC127811033 n=1 Tax=Diospyros lotus TaxID=55363 RepID=UPI00224CBABE|nr:uncharacterized protein LOC127811033 [Diospyros lotus]
MPRGLFPCFGGRSASSEPDAAPTADQAAEEDRRAGPVVAELFSSQGCGTSPEAELLMSRLGRGDSNLEVPVIVLAYHVDYWDYTGWKDPFASSQWTVRQKAYVEALKLDTMFTPQLVVQGAAQCVANDLDAVVSAIRSAPRFPLPKIQATFQRTSPETLQVSLSGALRNKVDDQGATVMVALYESGLVTECTTGANKDRVLPNDFVVRKLEKICSVKDISAKKTITGTATFSLWEGFNSRKSGVAVFVQNGSHRVFGAQNFQLPENL